MVMLILTATEDLSAKYFIPSLVRSGVSALSGRLPRPGCADILDATKIQFVLVDVAGSEVLGAASDRPRESSTLGPASGHDVVDTNQGRPNLVQPNTELAALGTDRAGQIGCS